MEWIKVSERLPEEREEVLLYLDGFPDSGRKYWRLAEFYEDAGHFGINVFWVKSDDVFVRVDAYLPVSALPAPPIRSERWKRNGS